MDWTQAIDAYCERTSADFWAEPANALSNIAFFIAAAIAFWMWAKKRIPLPGAPEPLADRPSLFLICLVGVIGLGSFLFHTVAESWASLADVVPIAVFIYAYFALALRRLAGYGRVATVLLTLAFLVFSLFADVIFGPLFGSSAGYVPALLALYIIGFGLLLARKAQGGLVTGAALVFSLSLACRMADEPLCPAWPLGTHFVWHILNAATLFLLLAAAIRQGSRRRRRRRITP